MQKTQQDLEETTAALREAIREMEAGDVGIPLEEFDREFRAARRLRDGESLEFRL